MVNVRKILKFNGLTGRIYVLGKFFTMHFKPAAPMINRADPLRATPPS
jgi:hypothetical protein